VEIFQFDRGEKIIEYFGSQGGLVALTVEGAPMSLFEPEAAELQSVL
jgi:hypothetical protein